jgi:hypothetical protein
MSLLCGLLLLYIGLSFEPASGTVTLEDVGFVAGLAVMGVGVGRTCFGVFAVGVTAALLGLIRRGGRESWSRSFSGRFSPS